jgi:hypothetical protein
MRRCEQIHVPEQKQGNVGSIPLFPVRGGGDGRGAAASAPRTGARNAFDPAMCAEEGPIHAVVVGRLSNLAGTKSPLTDEVRVAWENFSPQITAAVNSCRAGSRLPQVPTQRPDGGFVLAHLAVDRAFESEASRLRLFATTPRPCSSTPCTCM